MSDLPSWHLSRGGQQFGPYTWGQVVDLARGGQLAPQDTVWQQGMAQWVPAHTLPGLFAAHAPPPPYAPPGAAAPPGAFAAPPPGPGAVFHVQRAFMWNLRAVPVLEPERAQLIALSVDEENARRYLAWRKSVLYVVTVPLLASAILALINVVRGGQEGMSSFGVLAQLARVASLFILPLASFLAARSWSRHKASRRTLVWLWAIAFVLPLLIALAPMEWHLDLGEMEGDVKREVMAGLGLLGALNNYITLMPAVLSLLPGVLRACLRVKALLPESILPGWFLVAAAPLYVLLFLVVFVTVNQIAGNPLLILGVLALVGAPSIYLANAGLFTRPLHTEADVVRIGRVQNAVKFTMLAGVALLVIYLFTAEIFGKKLVGFEDALMKPYSLKLMQFPIEYLSRSLLTTALVADLIMLMNLSVWHHTKLFVKSEQAGEYDRLMSEIEEAGGRS